MTAEPTGLKRAVEKFRLAAERALARSYAFLDGLVVTKRNRFKFPFVKIPRKIA